jgi:hypothetical protein
MAVQASNGTASRREAVLKAVAALAPVLEIIQHPQPMKKAFSLIIGERTNLRGICPFHQHLLND